jgi:hypothetical protein
MKTKNTIYKNFGMMALVIILSVNIFGQTNAQPIQATFFGMHQFSPGQTAAISVVNRNPSSDSEIIPCIRVMIIADIYETSLTEFTKLRFSRRVTREEKLEKGEALSFKFQPSRTTDSNVSVSVFVYPDEEVASPELIRSSTFSTLQVIENGRSLYTLPGVIKGFDPQPDPPATK